MLDIIRCKCQTEFDEEKLKSHFSNCYQFNEAFREFDKEYGKLLKKYSQPAENLPILKFLLKQYTVVIDDKIKKMKIDVSGSRAPDDSPNKDNIIAPSFRRDDVPEQSRINNHNLEQVQRVNQNINPSSALNIYYENRNEIINNDCNNDQELDNSNYGNNISNPYLSSRLELPNREIPEFQQNSNNFMKENRFNKDFDHDIEQYSSPENPSSKFNNKINYNNYAENNNKNDFNNKINYNKNPIPKINDFNQNNNLFDLINKESSNVDKDFTYAHKNNYGGGYKYHDDYIQPETDTCMCCYTIEDLLPLECYHMICNKCFLSLAEKDINNIRCNKPDCAEKVRYQHLQMILGEKKLTQLEKMSVEKIVNEIGQGHTCPGCGELIIFEVGQVDYKIKDGKNQIISRQAAKCYAQNRCKCPICQKEFCINCNFSPFHLGKTCEKQRKLNKAKKSTLWNSEIKSNNQGSSEDVCKALFFVVLVLLTLINQILSLFMDGTNINNDII